MSSHSSGEKYSGVPTPVRAWRLCSFYSQICSDNTANSTSNSTSAAAAGAVHTYPGAQHAAKAEVAQLDDTVLTQEDVVRFLRVTAA